MPSIRGRLVGMVIRGFLSRRFRRAGRSIPAWRELEGTLVRSQLPLKDTTIEPVSLAGVEGEWVRAPGSASGVAVLYLHGGGFIMGSPATHRELASRISSAAGAPVFSLAYKLAPENPFPAALEDTKGAFGWLLSEGYEPDRIVIGGDSAGGGLALQALLALREEGAVLPGGAFFLSPVLDWVEMDGESYSTREEVDPMNSRSQCEWTASLYAGGKEGEEPLLRPLSMGMEGLPPLWIHVGDHEVLLSDGQRLAERARNAGIYVEWKNWPGMWHVFQNAARLVPEGRLSLDDLGRFVRACFSMAGG